MFFDVGINVDYDRIDQRGESDLAFLQRLCEDAGLAVKVTDSRLVIFDEAEYGKKAAVSTIQKNSGIIDCNFRAQAHDIYRACRVKYYDAIVKKTFEYTHEAKNISSGQVLVDNRRVHSYTQAKQRAKNLLYQKNKREVAGSVSLSGKPGLVAGVNVMLEGFGAFSDKYLITKAVHGISGGYTTRIDVQRAEND
jgi:phage protein D